MFSTTYENKNIPYMLITHKTSKHNVVDIMERILDKKDQNSIIGLFCHLWRNQIS